MMLAVGGVAAFLQFLGYAIYFAQAIRGDNRPNGMSWLMWSYGTAIIFFVEYDSNAELSLLLLPGMCSLGALLIGVYSFIRSRYIPPDTKDLVAFAIDLGLTIDYVAITVLFALGALTSVQMERMGFAILVFTSVSTMVSFYPILRSTYSDPSNEVPLPWLVWSSAYTILLGVVIIEGFRWEYAVYPAINLVLHFSIAVIAFLGAQRDPLTTSLAVKS